MIKSILINLIVVCLSIGVLYRFKIIKSSQFEPTVFEDLKVSAVERNSILNNAKIIFENELLGPESVAVAPNGSLYTGTFGGHIWRIDGNKKTKIATIDNGRPLGIRIDTKGNLYVIEANSGIYKIDKNSKVEKILGMNGNNGKDFVESKFLNDLVIVEGVGTRGAGIIYFTDVSTKFSFEYLAYVICEPDSTGRVIKYDIGSNKLTVLLNGLKFPNGIEINDEKSALIISESLGTRILKYYLNGKKKGLTETLIQSLPGTPDNIRRSKSKRETYWVALALVPNKSEPLRIIPFSSYPLLRKILVETVFIFGSTLNSFGEYLNVETITRFGHYIKTLRFVTEVFSDYSSMAVEIDSKGSIVRTLQSSDNKVSLISEVNEVSSNLNSRTLYLGTFGKPHLTTITIDK